MKKTTKGALAAGTAAFMMLGGAGTFAIWTDDATADAGVIESGSMSIAPVIDEATGSACSSWTHQNGRAAAAEPPLAVSRVVPGDVIEKTCSFTVRAEGENLEAVLTTPASLGFTPSKTDGTVVPESAAISLPITATYELDEGAVQTVTQDDDGEVLVATITASFPLGTSVLNGNNTQNLLADLDALTVQLDQVRQTP
ncbi:alternate-type signal peptide domain-containing protein [Nocardioides perillae]|uniref:Alternate signal-mediated exported protein n=1 Tax=Nocardioides perillae TaxID=1119534 RepID=A0A7Y9RX15_9ACTN|nr:alternate-type signal peptide domain-containing protein [Nocardioides perillae]NYG56108.1 alternate signal-mediated exported protein [Nocardioides perillae]